MDNRQSIQTISNFSEYLQTYGVDGTASGFYWQVGEIARTQGWILHLSVIEIQLSALLPIIIPELLAENIPFKIVRDERTAQYFYEGSLGYTNLGKMVSIYPVDDAQALRVGKKLITLTEGFRGPDIPTDLRLGGIVYTRYGSHNPILQVDDRGQTIKTIYDAKGQMIADPYTIPFTLPAGIRWPFQELASPVIPARRKLLNYAYYPLVVLKPDVKGEVIKGLYFKKLWSIKSCLIKQGRRDMFSDPDGRDIQDRLKWQYELYQALKNDIPMPEVFDYFEEYGDTYLAMQFIHGISLRTWILGINQARCWRFLPRDLRLINLKMILKLLTIIQTLHEKGYIHRDITAENFLIDPQGKIFLIDMELAWSSVTGQPAPPFRLGTPGHMSPEQERVERPTVKEDVYGFGGLMVIFFTGFFATKFNVGSPEQLKKALHFLIGDPSIVELIADSLETDPSRRPGLAAIRQVLTERRDALQTETAEEPAACPLLDPAFLQQTIQSALNGLTLWQTMNSERNWISPSQRRETNIGNAQIEMALYEGWHTGMAGPLWLIARAKRAGYRIGDCQGPFAASWNYIGNNYFQAPEKAAPGLYTGGAGIAMAMTEGLASGLMVMDPSIPETLAACFLVMSNELSLADGIAGQGLALLRSAELLDKEWVDKILRIYIDRIMSQQQKDGSWNLVADGSQKNDIQLGLDRGVAGVTWFLLAYLQDHPDARVEGSVRSSLNWLLKNRKKKDHHHSWLVSTRSKTVDVWSSGEGVPGILLLFVKAYGVLQDPVYKKIAMEGLLDYPAQPVMMDYTLSKGLAGLGEVYIEAFRALGDRIFLERAGWIAGLFAHTAKEAEERVVHWLADMYSTTADLFIGNSGIIYFLLRYQAPEKWGHPLWFESKERQF